MNQKQNFQKFLQEAGLTEQQYRQQIGFSSRKKRIKANLNEDLYLNSIQLENSISRPIIQKVNFMESYIQLMKQHPQIKQIKQNLNFLKFLYDQIHKKDGVISITSNGYWNEILKIILDNNHPIEFNQNSLFEYCRKYILPFEIYAHSKSKAKKIQYTLKLQMMKFIQSNQFKQAVSCLRKGLKFYDQKIVIIRNGQEVLNLDTNLINLDTISQLYATYQIDIRIQRPCDYGFIAQKLSNQKFQMTIQDYRQYQKIYNNQQKIQHYKYAHYLKNGSIFFGVNFDPQQSDNQIVKEIEKTLGESFLAYKQKFDLLSYLDQEIPGCSFPQFYFKVKGCWTGGHQQNICMSAININHGPDQSEWYAMDFEYVQSLRSLLKQQFSMDLYLSQGLWYQKINWFLQRGFPVRKLIQKKGDVVVSGPGTLHWVRSFGVSLQSAWNVMPKTFQQIRVAKHRHTQNKKINFRKKNVIPMKSIFLQYLNHEHHLLQIQIKKQVLKYLKQWFNQQQQYLKQLQKNKKIVRNQKYISQVQSFCKYCSDQVFIYFIKDPLQPNNSICCLNCVLKNNVFMINCDKVYYKFCQFNINKLFDICSDQNLNKLKGQIIQLCHGIYIGEVRCCQTNKDTMQQSSQNSYQYNNKYRQKIITQKQELYQLIKNKKQDTKIYQILQKPKSKQILDNIIVKQQGQISGGERLSRSRQKDKKSQSEQSKNNQKIQQQKPWKRKQYRKKQQSDYSGHQKPNKFYNSINDRDYYYQRKCQQQTNNFTKKSFENERGRNNTQRNHEKEGYQQNGKYQNKRYVNDKNYPYHNNHYQRNQYQTNYNRNGYPNHYNKNYEQKRYYRPKQDSSSKLRQDKFRDQEYKHGDSEYKIKDNKTISEQIHDY